MTAIMIYDNIKRKKLIGVIFLNEAIKKDFNKWFRPFLLAVALLFFVIRTIQMITEMSTQLALPAATLYLLDYNFYIGSRTFIGSILTLLTPHITYQQIFVMNISVYVITILSFFGLGIYTVRKAIKENNDFLFLVAVLFIVCPYSLLRYANWVGTYDIYLSLFAVLCGIMSSSKRMHWLCPVLCVMAMFTHYAFAFSYFPAVFAVQIYNIITSDKKKSRILSTSTGLVASFVSAVYCGFFANNTIKMTRDELYAYMENRLGTQVENKPYIDSYYFDEDVYGMLRGFQDSIINSEFKKNFVLFFLPVMLLFIALWCYYIIKSEKKQMLSGGLFVLTAVVSIALVFLINEAPRWQTAAILSQFLIFFVLIKKDDATVAESFKKLNKLPINAAMLIFIIYNMVASCVIKPFFS